MRVRDLMTHEVVTVAPEMPLKDVAQTLVAHRITGVPVVSDGEVVGIVSQSDIVELEERAEAEALEPRRLLRRKAAAAAAPRTAAELMRAPVVTVEPQSSVVGAAWTMTSNDVSRLPVVERGRLVGILTRSDLIRGFVRPDADVRQEIVADVLPALGISPNDVAVSVDHGIVSVRGVVEDEAEARCLPHALRGVMGVVDVVAEISALHAHRRFDELSTLF